MTKRLLIGSANRHKAEELADLLRGLPWDVVSLAEMPPIPSPVEDADTFEANARIKALYYARSYDMPCVADDSGLVVDVLNGEPGVLSARYAGEGCTYADNNIKLLSALAGVEDDKRTGRFVCCAVFVGPDGSAAHAEFGAVEGRIAHECRGTNGFGYDPLFIPDGFQQTFGELDVARKHSISHRGRAFAKMRAYLESLR